MKRIIDNKLYDTDTATLVYEDKSLRFAREYYRTDKGTFFFYSVQTGKIDLVSEQIMKNILADKDADKYIEIFGNVVEG